MSLVQLLAGWLGGMLLGSALLLLWDVFHPGPDKVLSILGLLLWLATCIGLALLLAQWWLPAT